MRCPSTRRSHPLCGPGIYDYPVFNLNNWDPLCCGSSHFCRSIGVVVFPVAPFEVVSSVICFVFVFMVYLWESLWVFNKRLSDESVNRSLFYIFVFR